MKHLFFADLRELKWAFLWVSVVIIGLTFVGYHFNWGMYHAANSQYMWTSLPIIGAYMPAVLLIADNGRSPLSRLASVACQPLNRIQIGLSRYLAPLTVLAVACLAACLAVFAEQIIHDWYYTRGVESEVASRVFQSALDSLQYTWIMVSIQILLGAAAMTIPLIADDIWPQARSKSYGIIAILVGSFIVSELVAYSVQGLWVARLPWVLAGTVVLVALEIRLFSRRSTFV